jgi:subfamily B ATP-binding cassette protein MsbA
MFYQNWKLALFAIFMMPLAGFFGKRLGKRIGKVADEAGEVSGILTTFYRKYLKAQK